MLRSFDTLDNWHEEFLNQVYFLYSIFFLCCSSHYVILLFGMCNIIVVLFIFALLYCHSMIHRECDLELENCVMQDYPVPMFVFPGKRGLMGLSDN